MTKQSFSKIITANLLHTGDVVYLDQESNWVHQIEKALVVSSEEQIDSLVGAAQQSEVIDPYAIDVSTENPEISAIGNREKIRQQGPSVIAI